MRHQRPDLLCVANCAAVFLGVAKAGALVVNDGKMWASRIVVLRGGRIPWFVVTAIVAAEVLSKVFGWIRRWG
ncbi:MULTISPECIES: hypothetical protein [unclassified Arthrobacter]|uniref:hypothetical protein n=1 Tax=unclassified Arthrobacter TaxID=235627 RepID=UPI0033951411